MAKSNKVLIKIVEKVKVNLRDDVSVIEEAIRGHSQNPCSFSQGTGRITTLLKQFVEPIKTPHQYL